MTEEEVDAFIAEGSWTFAKTMARIPHWYVVRNRCDPARFRRFVEYVRANGVVERFMGRDFTYLYRGEWKYWTMGAPVEETTIVNRARVPAAGGPPGSGAGGAGPGAGRTEPDGQLEFSWGAARA